MPATSARSGAAIVATTIQSIDTGGVGMVVTYDLVEGQHRAVLRHRWGNATGAGENDEAPGGPGPPSFGLGARLTGGCDAAGIAWDVDGNSVALPIRARSEECIGDLGPGAGIFHR